eukprot:GHVT01039362.1.p1 GENE.GHVT01039362.1~~GHVT01039362.1.p1  ORF type:complete len:246 (+),score=44.02 GHVT01039362.1:184-921(+)
MQVTWRCHVGRVASSGGMCLRSACPSPAVRFLSVPRAFPARLPSPFNPVVSRFSKAGSSVVLCVQTLPLNRPCVAVAPPSLGALFQACASSSAAAPPTPGEIRPTPPALASAAPRNTGGPRKQIVIHPWNKTLAQVQSSYALNVEDVGRTWHASGIPRGPYPELAAELPAETVLEKFYRWCDVTGFFTFYHRRKMYMMGINSFDRMFAMHTTEFERKLELFFHWNMTLFFWIFMYYMYVHQTYTP